ncbi:MAG: RICIN domain-containing protein, partial [Chitinophagales bacterium]|nr:RICIN domain-containing protein [Chitinophagales bacterium]
MKPPSVNAATFLLTLLCLTDIWAQPSVFDRQRIHSNQINEAAVSTKVYLFPLESGVYRIEFGNYALQQVASKEAVKLAIANSVNSYQHWIFTQNGNNTYTISNFESGRCLSHDAATGKLQTTSCQGNDD